MREEKILHKLCDKDPDGLRALMDRYIPYVSTVVWNILRYAMTQEDAEEVVSDVFLAAWHQAAQLQPGKVKAWLGAGARNKANNNLVELSDGTTPLDMLQREEERGLVRQAVDSLQPKDRQIFLRHYYYAQTVEEIAKHMKMPTSTVKSRLRRGRMKLKEYLIRREL